MLAFYLTQGHGPGNYGAPPGMMPYGPSAKPDTRPLFDAYGRVYGKKWSRNCKEGGTTLPDVTLAFVALAPSVWHAVPFLWI